MKIIDLVRKYRDLEAERDLWYNIWYKKDTTKTYKAMEKAMVDFQKFRNKEVKILQIKGK